MDEVNHILDTKKMNEADVTPDFLILHVRENLQQMELLREKDDLDRMEEKSRYLKEIADEVGRVEREKDEVIEKLHSEKDSQRLSLERELRFKVQNYERLLEETKEEAELKWSKAADEIRDVLRTQRLLVRYVMRRCKLGGSWRNQWRTR